MYYRINYHFSICLYLGFVVGKHHMFPERRMCLYYVKIITFAPLA